MKNKFWAFGTLSLGMAFSLISFDHTEAATGGINAKVTVDETPVAEVLVGVATSAENRENSDYIHEKETNAQGVISFTGLAAGTYYLDAYITLEEADYWAEAEVTVGTEAVDVHLELEEEE